MVGGIRKAVKADEVIGEWLYHGYTMDMKTAISLPDDLFREADAFANERGLSRSEIYATALKDSLRNHNASTITEQINAVCKEIDTSLPGELKAHTLRQLREVKW